MKSEDENMELEKEAPNLGAISRENTFGTPDGYFETLRDQILNQVKLHELRGETRDFKVPVGYFENLSQQIQSSVYVDQLKSTNSAENEFTVPAHYFEQSQERIVTGTLSKSKKSNVVTLHFVRYAAAACILLTTSLGIYFNVKHNTAIEYQLSKVPASEIESYLKQHTDRSDLPMLIENIDDDINLTIDDFELEQNN